MYFGSLRRATTNLKHINRVMEVAPRKLYLMRHAERVDFTFGAWIPMCFDEKNQYHRRNLNMPKSLPNRVGGPWDYFYDGPLTNIGHCQATLTGEAMKDCDIKFDHVFCSPSLRCIETCSDALKGAEQSQLAINIEPGLFEWLAWYVKGRPAWMSPEELRSLGFNVRLDYAPEIPVENLTNILEQGEEYYVRSFYVTKRLLEKYSGTLLFVGHASTLDACSRQLVGRHPRTGHDINCIVQKIPYASVAVIEEKPDKSWQLMSPPFPALMHCNNMSFDWQVLCS